MYQRIIVGLRSDTTDSLGVSKRKDIENFLGLTVKSVRTRSVYTIHAELGEGELDLIKRELFTDPITQEVDPPLPSFDWLIEVGFRSGVTDNVGRTSKTAIVGLLKRDLKEHEAVYTSRQYLIEAPQLKHDEAEKIARELLANDVIERWTLKSYDEIKKRGLEIQPPVVIGDQKASVMEYDLKVSDDELMRISQEGVLALSLEEMKAIRAYFETVGVVAERNAN
jgi:phosphoribosylformylglycinamidine synthase